MIAPSEIEISSQPLLLVSAQKVIKEDLVNVLKLTPFNSTVLDLAEDEATIEAVRGILKKTNFKPQFGKFYFLIFLNCELLSREIANTLLKTLEEPPEYLRIVLVAANERALLPTILSRCRKRRISGLRKGDDGELAGIAEVDRMSLAERFALAQNLAEGKPEAQIVYWLEELKNQGISSQYVGLFALLVDSHQKLVNYNLNKRLLLENIFLNWPTTTKLRNNEFYEK